MTTNEVLNRTGLNYNELVAIMERYAIEVPVGGNNKRMWDEESLQQVHKALDMEINTLNTREVADRLGITPSRVLYLVREFEIGAPRTRGSEGLHRFSEVHLAQVKKAEAISHGLSKRELLDRIMYV